MSYNPFSLEGKTILVTGASSGIGRAASIECAKLGANMVITARNEHRLLGTLERLDTSRGATHRHFFADLTQENEIKQLVSVLPKLDGVLQAAGKGLTLPMQFASREKMDDIFRINLFSQVELLRLLYKKKILNKAASVVLVASIGGTHNFTLGNGVYGASKAALNSTMRYCALEFASRLIRVNSICPGMVDTPLIHNGTISDDQLKEDAKKYPLGRYGQPEDIAHLAAFLLGDASSWITGQDFIIDGGITI